MVSQVLFSALAEACIRVGNIDLPSERTQAFEALQGLGKIFAPTYGFMLKATGDENLERVWELWKEMVSQVLFSVPAEAGIRVGNLDLLSERTQAFAALQGLGKIFAPTYGF